MKTSNKLIGSVRAIVVGISLGSVLLPSSSALAGAVSCDSRNCAWGTARVDEGNATAQYNLAVRRAMDRGGANPYIRAYQFNVPRGSWVVYLTGYVPSKGWCGNWSYDFNSDRAFDKCWNAMINQGAQYWTISFRKVWQE